MSEPTLHITEVATVAVPTRDHAAALAFYVDTLGFEVRMDAEFAPGMRWVEIAPPGGGPTSIALAPAPEGAVTGVDTGIRLTTGDADADHTALTAAGVDVDDEVLRWPDVPPMFSFRDPEGNTLYLVERG
jgi:catechol 2,3-dioxygenase-like lactoylglutathione lyase family enzyme